MKFGVKCEIHLCTLKFMEEFLQDFYSKEEMKTINLAFNCRNAIQYYVDRVVQKTDFNLITSQAPFFYQESKEILMKLTEDKIKNIRGEISKYK